MMEGMIGVTTIEVNAEMAAEASEELLRLGRVIGGLMREQDRIEGGLAEKKGLDLEKIIEDARNAMAIGAAACRMLADAMKEVGERNG